MLMLLAEGHGDPLEHILSHDLFHIHVGGLDLGVNNHMVMALVAAVLMLLIFPTLFRRVSADAPRGARNFFESILEFLRVEVFRPALKENTDRFVPFLWTLFFFILFCNLLGLIPLPEILTLIRGEQAHIGGTATGNISTTAALAICALIAIHASGVIQVYRDLRRGTYGHHPEHEEHSANGHPPHEAAQDLEHMRGEGLAADVPQQFSSLKSPAAHYADDQHVPPTHHAPVHGATAHGAAAAAVWAVPLYLWNFAPHPFRPKPGESIKGWFADIPVWGLLLVLELIGAIIKPIALSLRLFANMIAGHLVLSALVALIVGGGGVLAQIGIGIPVTVLSLLIRFLELFVAFLQAYIFTFLTTLFIASSVAPEH